MSLPILFLHRTDDDYLGYVLRQAKIASPQSEVILIGSPENSKYAADGIKHALIQDYNLGAAEFESVYKHITPNEFFYNMFCFQRWFILRDYMRANRISECWTLDTDVMLYADLNRTEYRSFSGEFTWTTFVPLKDLEEICTLTLSHFKDAQLFEYLKVYTKEVGQYIQETGMLAVSDMVTQMLHFDKYIKRNRIHGIVGDSFFDNNLYSSFPGVEMIDDKKKIYFINDSLFCKKTDTGQLIKMNTVHFTTVPNKKYIGHFYGPNLLPYKNGAYFFDYAASQWLPASI